MNSRRFGERERRKEKEKRFLVLLLLGSEFVQKMGESAPSTSPLLGLIKIKPLGRMVHPARAKLSSNRVFRTTLTDEWEVFRSPN